MIINIYHDVYPSPIQVFISKSIYVWSHFAGLDLEFDVFQFYDLRLVCELEKYYFFDIDWESLYICNRDLNSEKHGTQDMDMKNALRLSAVERNQLETNKRLKDMQGMLHTVLTTLSNNDVNTGKETKHRSVPALGESSGQGAVANQRKEKESAPMDNNEEWWDKLCKTSDDDSQKKDSVGDDGLLQKHVNEELGFELLYTRF